MMASVAFDRGVTLTPFAKTHSNFRAVSLLADSTFAVFGRQQQAPPIPNAEALAPQVIPVPNRARFEAAVARWLEDIEFDSLPDDMKEHDSFQDIVRDGTLVVPLIAAHLRRMPSFLFLALEEIFGEDPVPEEAYGRLNQTVSSWLRWLQR